MCSTKGKSGKLKGPRPNITVPCIMDGLRSYKNHIIITSTQTCKNKCCVSYATEQYVSPGRTRVGGKNDDKGIFFYC